MARVFRARDRESGQAVAMKAFKTFSSAQQPAGPKPNGAAAAQAEENELGGVPLEVLRECALLHQLRHPNIVRAHEVLTAPASVDALAAAPLFLAMELVDFDLGLLIEHMATPFAEGQVKCLCKQLLGALAALEPLGIAHRDLKQTNLLIDKGGVLRLADFGLARHLPTAGGPLTPDVTSLWYRAPEVLLGAHVSDRAHRDANGRTVDASGRVVGVAAGSAAAPTAGYGLAVDVWAFGILAAEWLRKGEPLLAGQSEPDQLHRIFLLLGTPTADSWPCYFDGSLPRARNIRLPPELTCEALDPSSGETVIMPRSQLRKKLPLRGYDPAVPSTAQLPTTGISAAGFELLSACLELDPRRRPRASEALRHRWFAEMPLGEPLTRFELRALSRARTAAISSGAHAFSIAQQNAQMAAAVPHAAVQGY
ncbi:kinase-like domain-containing protein [Pavlovales sp. CCMP2436]|nr:kinase-like domain-containing protein [Pavlovales sp. CCMP2436]